MDMLLKQLETEGKHYFGALSYADDLTFCLQYSRTREDAGDMWKVWGGI